MSKERRVEALVAVATCVEVRLPLRSSGWCVAHVTPAACSVTDSYLTTTVLQDSPVAHSGLDGTASTIAIKSAGCANSRQTPPCWCHFQLRPVKCELLRNKVV